MMGNKTHGILLRTALAASLLLALTGCSSGNSGTQPSNSGSQASSEQTELDKLKAENEALRAELEAAASSSKTVDPDEKNASTDPEPIEIVPPQVNSKELLIGEWFYQDFHEEEMNNWTQGLVFRTDGTGEIVRTFYLPRDLEDYSTSDPTGEVTLGFSWSLDGDALHTEYDGGSGFVDYVFSSEQQQLLIKNENGNAVSRELVYNREKPAIPSKYIEKILLLENMQAKEALLMRRFLGTWYFDVLTWNFNEDGTGFIDIPEIGDQPAEQRDFSYSITGDIDNLLMTFDWPDGRTSYFWPKVNADGSVTLQGADGSTTPVILTRIFDINNCPISEVIIENVMGVWTGSIFEDILPSYLFD